MIKFTHDTKHIKPTEEYRNSWFLNYDVDVIKRFWYEEEEEEFYHHVVRRCGSYKDIPKAISKNISTTKPLTIATNSISIMNFFLNII